ncbi:hypothetical protein ACFQYP_61350 [Nonomuraea antimicrobica]
MVDAGRDQVGELNYFVTVGTLPTAVRGGWGCGGRPGTSGVCGASGGRWRW